MLKLFFFQLAFVMLAFHQPFYAGENIRVACICNSITASLYPGYLATKMNSQGYNVKNFGYSGTTGTRGVRMGSSLLSWEKYQ